MLACASACSSSAPTAGAPTTEAPIPKTATLTTTPLETPSAHEPASDEIRMQLSRAAKAAGKLPTCTEESLRAAGATGPTSSLADVNMSRVTDYDFLQTGWFARAAARSTYDPRTEVVIVFVASDARIPSTASIDGVFIGRGVALMRDGQQPVCELRIAFHSADDTRVNYHELFQRALDKLMLGTLTPRLR